MKKHMRWGTSLLILIAVLLASCAKRTGDNTEQKKEGQNEQTQLVSGYIEKELNGLDEGMGSIAMKVLENGTIRLVTYDKIIYDSDTKGELFYLADIQMKALSEGNYYNAVAISRAGEILAVISGDGAEDEKGVILIDKNSNVTYIDMDWKDEEGFNQIQKLEFGNDGTFVWKDGMHNLYVTDIETGAIISSVVNEKSKSIFQFVCLGDYIITNEAEAIQVYDLKTGSPVSSEAGLVDFGREKNLLENNFYMTADEHTSTLYMCMKGGIYKYTLGTSSVELVLGGNSYRMAADEIYCRDLLVLEEGMFLALYGNFLVQGAENVLVCYEYVENYEMKEKPLVTIYSLRETEYVRHIIAAFRAEHPEYMLIWEAGITEENDLPAEDAIKLLNTQILMGEGPDIIFLDNLPAGSYIEKGVLENISDAVKAAAKNNDMFDNIINAGDAEIYKINTRFQAPVIVGKEADIQGISSLLELADKIEKFRADNPDQFSIIGKLNEQELVELLLYNVSSFMTEERTIDEEALSEFLSTAEKIYNANYIERPGVYENAYYYKQEDFAVYLNPVRAEHIILEKSMIGIGTFEDLSEYGRAYAVLEEKQWSIQTLNGQAENVYVPLYPVGINVNSEYTEIGKEFIAFLLSESTQMIENWYYNEPYGYPVNKDAFRSICKKLVEKYERSVETSREEGTGGTETSGGFTYDEKGNLVEYSYPMQMAGEQVTNDFMKQLDKLDTPLYTDQIVLDAVRAEAVKYLQGETDLDTAVQVIMRSVNLYLAE